MLLQKEKGESYSFLTLNFSPCTSTISANNLCTIMNVLSASSLLETLSGCAVLFLTSLKYVTIPAIPLFTNFSSFSKSSRSFLSVSSFLYFKYLGV